MAITFHPKILIKNATTKKWKMKEIYVKKKEEIYQKLATTIGLYICKTYNNKR